MEDLKGVIIIGGGLAGLTAAIHLAQEKIPVTLFEKEIYPHHKVCGEYISNEILPYFKYLSIPILELEPQRINHFLYSTINGKTLYSPLPLGGLGISRYALDHLLYEQAVKTGVNVINEAVVSVKREFDFFSVNTSKNNNFRARAVLGAFGKRSRLDKQLGRSFFKKDAPWLAVKSHYLNPDFPSNLVALHSFKGGYCGLSKTETGEVNACYLVSYRSFKKHRNPEIFRNEVLMKNPFLKVFFQKSTAVSETPLSIAQISFSSKKPVEREILMLGDSAGLIHPLCGNGMAMAVHSARIACQIILQNHERGNFSLKDIQEAYTLQWNKSFRKRIRTGKWLQTILLNQTLSNASRSIASQMPFLLSKIIKNTHGKPLA